MKVALVAMQELPCLTLEEKPFARCGVQALQMAEIAQILALARQMRDSGNFDPVLVCRTGGELSAQAADLRLPCLLLKNERDLAGWFRLWKWHRQQNKLLLLAFDETSLALARKIRRMHSGRGVSFAVVFLLRPPRPVGKRLKYLRESEILVCGSGLIRQDLLNLLEDSPERSRERNWIIHPPGLDLGTYGPVSSFGAKGRAAAAHRFVFCMDGSLLPRSGALLVVRAMAAIWQSPDLPPWEVRMFGEGPRFEEIVSEAANLGVLSRLSILACQHPETMINGCHAWLAPGSASWELPAVVGSALAAGLPLVCSRSPLHLEWLEYLGEKPALLVEKDNPQELARAMLDLARNEALRSRLAACSLACRNQAGVEEMAEKVCAALAHCLGL